MADRTYDFACANHAELRQFYLALQAVLVWRIVNNGRCVETPASMIVKRVREALRTRVRLFMLLSPFGSDVAIAGLCAIQGQVVVRFRAGHQIAATASAAACARIEPDSRPHAAATAEEVDCNNIFLLFCVFTI